MNELQKFMYNDKEVRVVVKEGEPWFVAADVCKLLGVGNASVAVRRIDAENVAKKTIDTTGGVQEVNAVNKNGVIQLVLASRKATKSEIKAWLRNSVFPQLGVEWTLSESNITISNSPDLRVFNHPSLGDVRTTTMNGEPWFVAVDVCKILSLTDTSQAMERIDGTDKRVFSGIRTANNTLSAWCVNEYGLYDLILESTKPEAKAFKRWIIHDVIPAIRKFGGYLTPEAAEKALQDPDFIIRLATALKEERAKRMALEEENLHLRPKAVYCDSVLDSEGLIATNIIAKDYGMSAKVFNQKLERLGIQYRRGEMWALKAEYQDKGYAQSKTLMWENSDKVKHWLYWTETGRKFLYDFLKEKGCVPVLEREQHKWQKNVI